MESTGGPSEGASGGPSESGEQQEGGKGGVQEDLLIQTDD